MSSYLNRRFTVLAQNPDTKLTTLAGVPLRALFCGVTGEAVVSGNGTGRVVLDTSTRVTAENGAYTLDDGVNPPLRCMVLVPDTATLHPRSVVRLARLMRENLVACVDNLPDWEEGTRKPLEVEAPVGSTLVTLELLSKRLGYAYFGNGSAMDIVVLPTDSLIEIIRSFDKQQM